MKESSKENPANDVQAAPRLIAFYLTQFHPIAENDMWWGKGFTEWTNVTKARPLFDSHYQPHLPTDFGFYDLRVRNTRHEQIQIAKQFGIDGFCYHYYWFSGTRLLNQPLDDMLADPESDMPFCLCWANENWTRRWDGAHHELLIAQRYLADDDLNFIQGLIPFFSDSRYIRIEGKPFLIVYRPQHLPNAKKTAGIWRDYCRNNGIGEIHLCAALTHGNEDYVQFGFDCGVEFPPHNNKCSNIAGQVPFYEPFRGTVVEYEEIAKSYIDRQYTPGDVHKCVFPSWDNTARTGNRAVMVLGGSPTNYEYWLAQTVDKTQQDFPGRERFVFINAWNEWAEGCHLEPDRKFGSQFLEATLRVKNGQSKVSAFSIPDSAPVAPMQKRFLGRDLGWVFSYHGWIYLGKLAAWLKKYPRLRSVVRWIVSRTS